MTRLEWIYANHFRNYGETSVISFRFLFDVLKISCSSNFFHYKTFDRNQFSINLRKMFDGLMKESI